MEQARQHERHTWDPNWEIHKIADRMEWPHEFGVLLGSNEAAARFPPTDLMKELSGDIAQMETHLDRLIMEISRRLRIPHRLARIARSLDLIVVFPFHPMPEDIRRSVEVVPQSFDSIQEFVRFRAVPGEETTLLQKILWKEKEFRCPKDLEQQPDPQQPRQEMPGEPSISPPPGFPHATRGQQPRFHAVPNQLMPFPTFPLGPSQLQSVAIWRPPPVNHHLPVQSCVNWPINPFGQIGGLAVDGMGWLLPPPPPHFGSHIEVVEQWQDGQFTHLSQRVTHLAGCFNGGWPLMNVSGQSTPASPPVISFEFGTPVTTEPPLPGFSPYVTQEFVTGNHFAGGREPQIISALETSSTAPCYSGFLNPATTYGRSQLDNDDGVVLWVPDRDEDEGSEWWTLV